MKYSEVSGIILAGGKSTRMGENKSLLILNQKTVIERMVDLMESVFKEVIIITNTTSEYDFIDNPKYKDIYEHKGPLAGIHSGLTHSKTEKNFVISCDLPLMEQEMLKYILNFKTEKPITVCIANGYIQQLAGIYSKSVLPTIEELFKKCSVEQKDGKRKIYSVQTLLNLVGAEILFAEELDIYKEHMFFNMNNHEDYKTIKTFF